MSISPDSNDQDEERALNVESIDDDAGGLFGSGSEDEDSEYGDNSISQLLLIDTSVPKMSAANVESSMMLSLIRETTKADSIVFWKIKVGKNCRRTMRLR